MMDEEDSILPESSASQQIEESSIRSLSIFKSDPDSISEHFIIKNMPEYLTMAEQLLNKSSDSVYRLHDFFNFIEFFSNLVLG